MEIRSEKLTSVCLWSQIFRFRTHIYKPNLIFSCVVLKKSGQITKNCQDQLENASPPQITSGSMEEPAVPVPTHTYASLVESQIQSLEVEVSTYSLLVLPTDGSSRAVRTLVQVRLSSLEIFSSIDAAAASALFAAASARSPAAFRSSRASMTDGVRGKDDDVGFPEIKPKYD